MLTPDHICYKTHVLTKTRTENKYATKSIRLFAFVTYVVEVLQYFKTLLGGVKFLCQHTGQRIKTFR